MPKFNNQWDLLVYMANVQYAQGKVLSEIANAVSRIEKRLPGPVPAIDPALEYAIKESKIHTDALKKVLDENS